MEEKIKNQKVSDRALEIFMWVFGVFIYSLALPLFLGIIWVLGGIYPWFMNFPWVVKVPVCILAGICLKNYISRLSLKKTKAVK